MNNVNLCPCGWEKPASQCCELYIDGKMAAPTPLHLMRSRYTAYALKRYEYIQSTMKPPASEKFNMENSANWSQTLRWEGLSILNYELKSPTLGIVSFKAYFDENGQKGIIAEKSEFKKIDDKWFYTDGKSLNPKMKPALAPDAPCLCQSKKQYQHCCGQKEYTS